MKASEVESALRRAAVTVEAVARRFRLTEEEAGKLTNVISDLLAAATVVEKMEKALSEFTDTINATGGVTEDDRCPGGYVPVVDHEWLDLGIAYEKACEVLGEEIIFEPKDEEEG